jgi:carbon monoxide dehydrogenase subunit G
MASIIKEILIDARPDHVWEAVRDFGAVDKRLVPGFVVDCRLDGDARIVTFANGLVAREPLVGLDEDSRRLAYTAVGGRATHYNASVQVFAEGKDRTRFVWIIDLLPNELAEPIGAMVEQGAAAMKRTLESR